MTTYSDKKENRFELREPIRSFLSSIKDSSNADACALYLISDKGMDDDEKKDEFSKRFPHGAALKDCIVQASQIDKYKVLKFIGVDDKDATSKEPFWKFDYKNRPSKYIVLNCDNPKDIKSEGITGKTARLKKIFYYKSEKEIRNCKARHPKSDTENKVHPMCHKILSIPILSDRREIVGVIRLDIYSADKAFNENYVQLYNDNGELSSDLYKVINGICDKLVLISNRDSETRSYIALYKGEQILKSIKQLKPHINSTGKINNDVFELLRHLFFVFQRHTYIGHDEIIRRVLYFIKDLCVATDLNYFDIIEKDLEAFRDHENLLLYDIEQYRDHFMHQFHVFVLGYVIINYIGIQKIADILNKKLKNSAKYKNANIVIEPENVLRIWVLISFFHDITYIIQKYNKGIKEFLKNLFNVDFSIFINWSVILSDKFSYSHYLNNLCDMFTPPSSDKTAQLDLLSGYFQSIESSQDHGVFSALLLMEQVIPYIRSEQQKGNIKTESANIAEVEAYLAGLAISVHNPFIFKRLKEGKHAKLSFESFPLEFLLVYCDTAQEWGRKKKVDGTAYEGPILKEVILTENKIIVKLEYPTASSPTEATLTEIVKERTGSFTSREYIFEVDYDFSLGGEPLEFPFS